jgi:hypothetical protein
MCTPFSDLPGHLIAPGIKTAAFRYIDRIQHIPLNPSGMIFFSLSPHVSQSNQALFFAHLSQ